MGHAPSGGIEAPSGATERVDGRALRVYMPGRRLGSSEIFPPEDRVRIFGKPLRGCCRCSSRRFTRVLTMKGKYGLKAMVHLAGVEPGKPELISAVAEENTISKKFLDAILNELRGAGLVRSKKGKGGGYMLAKPASKITVGEIIRVLDGPLAPIDCASRNFYRRCTDCTDQETCPVRRLMLEVRDAMARILDDRSLAEMRALSDLDAKIIDYAI